MPRPVPAAGAVPDLVGRARPPLLAAAPAAAAVPALVVRERVVVVVVVVAVGAAVLDLVGFARLLMTAVLLPLLPELPPIRDGDSSAAAAA